MKDESELVPINSEMPMYVAEYKSPFTNKTHHKMFFAPNQQTAQSVGEAYANGHLLWDVSNIISLVGAPVEMLEVEYFTEKEEQEHGDDSNDESS